MHGVETAAVSRFVRFQEWRIAGREFQHGLARATLREGERKGTTSSGAIVCCKNIHNTMKHEGYVDCCDREARALGPVESGCRTTLAV